MNACKDFMFGIVSIFWLYNFRAPFEHFYRTEFPDVWPAVFLFALPPCLLTIFKEVQLHLADGPDCLSTYTQADMILGSDQSEYEQ